MLRRITNFGNWALARADRGGGRFCCMLLGFHIVGYAIISADGMIADTAGQMPPAIVHEADQRFFSQGLDLVDVIVHGRHSHEGHPNSPNRRRLVLTRQAAALAPHPEFPNALLWNPSEATLEAACTAMGLDRGTVAVIGGTDVFGHYLPYYDTFHLTRAQRAVLPGGHPVFPGIPSQTPEALLAQHGMVAGDVTTLDPGAEISVRTWRREGR